MDALADVGHLIRERGAEFRRIVHARLFDLYPEARNLFPADMSGAHSELPRALAWVLERTRVDEGLTPELVKRLRVLGADHRRHGFPSTLYAMFGLFLGDAIAEIIGDDLPRRRVDAARALVADICSEMSQGAAEADLADIPAAYSAQVTSVRSAAHGVNVVQLESSMPIAYAAGQQLPVMPASRRGQWFWFSPALPANRFGQLEFHIPADIPVQRGEHWTLGNAFGDVALDPGRDALMVGIGLGTASVKALVFSLLEYDNPPQTHVVLAADYPAELYEAATFAALARSQEWLTVTVLVEYYSNPYGVSGDEARDAGLRPITLPVEHVVTGPGIFWDRQIILCGPITKATAVRNALLSAGATRSDISMITPTRKDEWPAEKPRPTRDGRHTRHAQHWQHTQHWQHAQPTRAQRSSPRHLKDW